MKITAKEKM